MAEPNDFRTDVANAVYTNSLKLQIACRLGLHTWKAWSDPVVHGRWHIQKRFCLYCNKEGVRKRRGIVS